MHAPLTQSTSRACRLSCPSCARCAGSSAGRGARRASCLSSFHGVIGAPHDNSGKSAIAQQPRAGDGRVRMRREAAHQRLDRAGRRHRVGIHQQHVVAARWRGCRGCWPSRIRGCRPTSITCTDGQRSRTCAAVPSGEALSTTVMVVGNGSVWPTSDSQAARRSPATELKVTMMIARLSLSATGGLLEDRERRGRGASPVVSRQHVAGVTQDVRARVGVRSAARRSRRRSRRSPRTGAT